MSNSEPNLERAITRKLIEHLESFLKDAREILGMHTDTPTEMKFELPNIDLHTVENDKWRSWKRDNKGACSFNAKPEESGWIRLKNCNNDTANLYKAMKKQGIDEVSLGLFRYKISGEFLQRTRLKKVEETETKVAAPIPISGKGIDNVRVLFPEDLAAMLTFEVKGEFYVIKPRQYLSSENFAKIASIIRDAGGEYISAGKQSHFIIPVKK